MSDLGNKEIMARNIQYYMDKYEKTRQDMCEALGVKYTTFTDWVKGNSYPRIDKIELMANYFGISKSDLVEEHKKDDNSQYYLNDETASIAQDIFENKELRLLFDAARDAEPEDLETVHSMLLALKRKERGNID
ncbi:MAG: helix-turn-helix domain-containing protein [Lachnospiraceae bacterium]|jgi:transcriptional regulator with XRE-family HTH domain